MLTANFVAQVVRDGKLQEMSGDSFVPEDWPRIFDRSTNVKVLRLRIVSWNEIETGRVFVVNTRRIHETARTCRLERFWQLPNLKRAQVIGQGDEILLFQEIDHLLLAAFVRFQERRLVRRNVLAPRWIGIGQLRIGKESFEGAITRQLR